MSDAGGGIDLDWLADNWLALLALIVAVAGGLPGILQAVDFFHPVSLVGSIKFYAPTTSVDPPESGIVLALTLLNQGRRAMVWRKLTGVMRYAGEEADLEARWIPDSLLLNGQPARPDLAALQSVAPGAPVNAFLLMVFSSGEIAGADWSSSVLVLQFEDESGKVRDLHLPLDVGGPAPPGTRFPSHPDIPF